MIVVSIIVAVTVVAEMVIVMTTVAIDGYCSDDCHGVG